MYEIIRWVIIGICDALWHQYGAKVTTALCFRDLFFTTHSKLVG